MSDQRIIRSLDCKYIEAIELFGDAVLGMLKEFEAKLIWYGDFGLWQFQDCFGDFVVGMVLPGDLTSSYRCCVH